MNNDYLLARNSTQIASYGLPPEYRDIPRLNILATVCCSILNSNHLGFYPLYMDLTQQDRAADLFWQRYFLQNPLLHPDDWPISFTTSGSQWQQLTFGQLDENDILDFPKLDRHSINPTALELTSGPHSILQADSVLTYMGQLLLKGRNLNREETARELENVPNDWKLYFTEVRTPAKPINVLNTVAETARQTTQVLPPAMHSVDIPAVIYRKNGKE